VLINQIKSLIAANKDKDLILISPYITTRPLATLCSLVDERQCITVYSRHDVEVFEQRSSSLRAFYYAHDQLNVNVFSVNLLHAKAYIAGNDALIGSANLTDRGLGLAPAPNLEVLVDVFACSVEVQDLLDRVFSVACSVSYSATRAIEDELVGRESSRSESLQDKVVDVLRRDSWLPSADLEYLARYFISGSKYGIPSVLRKSLERDANYLAGRYGDLLESIDAATFYGFVCGLELVSLFLEARVLSIAAVRKALPSEVDNESVEKLCEWLDVLVVGAGH